MYTYVLLILIATACQLIYCRFFSGSPYSPVAMFLYGMIMSTVLAIVGRFSWNPIQSVGPTVLAVLAVGILAATFGAATSGEISDRIFKKRNVGIQRFAIRIPMWRFLLIDALVLAAIAIRVSDVIRIANEMGIGNVSYPAMAAAVRNATSAFALDGTSQSAYSYTMLAKQTEKIIDAVGYVSCFLLVYSVCTKKAVAQISHSLMLLLLSIVYVLLSGARSTIFLWLISSVFYLLLIRQPTIYDIRSHLPQLLCCIAIAVPLVALAFYLSSIAVGRASGSGLVTYISFYFGSPIPSFESLVNSSSNMSIAPQLVFYNLFAFFSKLGIVGNLPSYSISWVTFSNFGSNVFTCFARYYFAFGYFGVLVLSYISAIIIELPYHYAKSTSSIPVTILTGYLAANAFDMIREEFVFSRLISIAQLLTLILIVLITLFLVTPHLIPPQTTKAKRQRVIG